MFLCTIRSVLNTHLDVLSHLARLGYCPYELSSPTIMPIQPMGAGFQ